jgi:serine/threonine protein kinase
MAYLESGAYGCIFTPPLKCSDKTSKKLKYPKNTVSKVFSSDDSFEDEKNIQKLIDKIDPDHKFTVEYFGSCDVNIDNVKLSNIRDCRHIDPSKKTTYKELIYSYGGIDLADVLSKERGNSTKFKSILKSFQPLIEGLKLIINKNYLHVDIKPENILLHKKRIYLIDFGLMTPIDQIYEKEYILTHDYPYYPPEFKYIVYKDKFVKKFLQNFEFKMLVNNTKINIYKALIEYLDYTIDEQLEDINNLSKLSLRELKLYADKTDIYSIGIVLLLFYIWSGSNSKKKNEKIKDLIKQMIRFNPQKRISIDDLIKQYTKLNTHIKLNKSN